MVEQVRDLDAVFSSLADPTRRDILRRVAKKELSVSEVAESYDLTLAAVSKHLQVLERAHLINKRRAGKQQFIALSPPGLQVATRYLKQYQRLWDERLDRLETYLKTNK